MLKLINIGKTYQNTGHIALKNINLSIEEGEFVALVGTSGSGKSTLINILACLDTADIGEYYIDDFKVCDVSSLSEIRLKKIGFIFQNFKLISKLSAIENVMLPLIFAKVPKIQRADMAKNALKKVGISQLENNKPSQMSGGQQQRVAIARAIVSNPKIILADEPTGNLDPNSCNDILSLLKMLHREGNTIILITHDMNIAKSANRIIKLENGELVKID